MVQTNSFYLIYDYIMDFFVMLIIQADKSNFFYFIFFIYLIFSLGRPELQNPSIDDSSYYKVLLISYAILDIAFKFDVCLQVALFFKW